MRGFPKHLNTRSDYEYVRTHFPCEKWEPYFKALLDTAYSWFFVGTLENESDGINDETHKVVTHQDVLHGEQRIQYEWKKNPQAKIFEIGYTEDEVKDILSQE